MNMQHNTAQFYFDFTSTIKVYIAGFFILIRIRNNSRLKAMFSETTSEGQYVIFEESCTEEWKGLSLRKSNFKTKDENNNIIYPVYNV